MLKITILVLFSLNLFAQEADHLVEIFLGTVGFPPNSSTEVRYYLDIQGTAWGNRSCDKCNEQHEIITNNNYLHNSFSTFGNSSTNPLYWWGWEFICSISYNGEYPAYGYGIYRLSSNESFTVLFIDFRDCNYPAYLFPYGHPTDIWIKYDVISDKFYYTSSPNIDWQELTSNYYLSIWNVKNQSFPISPNNSNFNNFWQNCLVLIPTSDNHPRLVWGPYPESKQLSCSLFC